MGKKDKFRNASSTQGAAQKGNNGKSPLISSRGWKVIGGGLAALVLGYIVLSLTDPQGKNWASQLSPLLIIGGYAAIGVGIVIKDPQL